MDLSQMIVQLASDVAIPGWRLLFAVGILLGAWYTVSVLVKLVRANTVPGQPQMTVGDVLPVLIIGAMVANYADSLNAAWQTFGTGSLSYGAINYPGASGFGPLAPAVNAVLTLAALFGGFFGLKGLVLIRKANNGASSHGAEDYVWKGLGHLFGGAALANIPRMIDAARASLHLVW